MYCDNYRIRSVVWYWPVWVFPKIGVPQNGWFIMENPIKMGWFGGTPIFGNIRIAWYFPWCCARAETLVNSLCWGTTVFASGSTASWVRHLRQQVWEKTDGGDSGRFFQFKFVFGLQIKITIILGGGRNHMFWVFFLVQNKNQPQPWSAYLSGWINWRLLLKEQRCDLRSCWFFI